MNYIRIVLAMALTVGSAGVALAAGGGGNGGATPPNVTVPAAVGSANAEPPSYIVSGTTPTGSSTSSNHWAGQGPEAMKLNGQPIAQQPPTLNGPEYTAE